MGIESERGGPAEAVAWGCRLKRAAGWIVANSGGPLPENCYPTKVFGRVPVEEHARIGWIQAVFCLELEARSELNLTFAEERSARFVDG